MSPFLFLKFNVSNSTDILSFAILTASFEMT